MSKSSIEWTEMTWNPVTGCTKVSAGCKYCYAEVMSRRLTAMGVDKYRNGFNVTLHPESLGEPYKWKKGKVVFVNSMSDLFHPEVPVDFIQKVFLSMKENPRHIFQVLTKRTERLLEIDQQDLIEWPENVWIGTSVEDDRVVERIDDLRNTKARVKFLSCEPLIGPLHDLNLYNIDWVIVGGESGRRPRYMDPDWVVDLKEQCEQAQVPFFFKQWGGTNKKKAGRVLEGRTWDGMPAVASC